MKTKQYSVYMETLVAIEGLLPEVTECRLSSPSDPADRIKEVILPEHVPFDAWADHVVDFSLLWMIAPVVASLPFKTQLALWGSCRVLGAMVAGELLEGPVCGSKRSEWNELEPWLLMGGGNFPIPSDLLVRLFGQDYKQVSYKVSREVCNYLCANGYSGFKPAEKGLHQLAAP